MCPAAGKAQSEEKQGDSGTNPIHEQQRKTLTSAAQETEVTKAEEKAGTTPRQSLRTQAGKKLQ